MQCKIFSNEKTNSDALTPVLFYLDKYYPYRHRTNPKFNSFSGLILDVKEQKPNGILYFTTQLRSFLSSNEEFVICVIPSHEYGIAPSGIRTIAKNLCRHPIIDGTAVIKRIKEMPKKTSGGIRNRNSEIESLGIENENIVKGKQVLLLDDVTTSGTSLYAGKQILEKAGAKLVVMHALALTESEG